MTGRWEIASCGTMDFEMLRALLADDWEPFSVADGVMWFKRARE